MTVPKSIWPISAEAATTNRFSSDRWSKGRRLPEGVNAGNDLICASVTPDGKYMLWSQGMDIYWVEARLIEEMRRIPSCRDSIWWIQ